MQKFQAVSTRAHFSEQWKRVSLRVTTSVKKMVADRRTRSFVGSKTLSLERIVRCDCAAKIQRFEVCDSREHLKKTLESKGRKNYGRNSLFLANRASELRWDCNFSWVTITILRYLRKVAQLGLKYSKRNFCNFYLFLRFQKIYTNI